MSALSDLAQALTQHPIEQVQAAAQTTEARLCGVKTIRNTPCQYRGAKCPTHSLSPKELSKSRRNAARAFKHNNPEGFKAQRRAAGHKGFLATGAMQGFEKACGHALKWRLKHPSIPEQWAIDLLTGNGISFEREFAPDGDVVRAVDFRMGHRIVEINHPKTDKTAWLEGLGYQVLNVNLSEKDVTEKTPQAEAAAATLLAFVAEPEQVNSPMIRELEELPF